MIVFVPAFVRLGSCSALLETGVYCAAFLHMAFGDAPPEAVAGANSLLDASSGLDSHTAALLRFPGGGVGTLDCSLRHPSPRDATVCGTKGVLRVSYPFWCPTRFTLQSMGGTGSQAFGPEKAFAFELPTVDDGLGDFNFVNSEGLAYEAGEVNRCLRAGLLESPTFGAGACQAVMDTLTAISAAI